MLEKWLQQQDLHEVSTVLQVQHLTTSDAVDQHAAEQWLGQDLLRNYVHPEERALLEQTFRDLGQTALADHLISYKFPSDVKVRSGDFGEALSGAWYRRARRWCVPLLKLRYKHRPNQPVQGVDFLAFRLREDPPVVATPEVKTRLNKQLNVGVEAVASLQGVLDDLPSSLQFAAARLLDRKIALGARLMTLLVAPYRVERHIVLVQDDAAWDERIVDRVAAQLTDRTEMSVIRLRDLRSMIGRAYSAAATVAQARTDGRSAALPAPGSAPMASAALQTAASSAAEASQTGAG
ncbi:hypothetical protein [Nonomuraea jabiensis]|uniref:hypothetical protein n=1 Tax=Nonomuraea jabiensis TaxID=882448 RepID=UPI003D71D764